MGRANAPANQISRDAVREDRVIMSTSTLFSPGQKVVCVDGHFTAAAKEWTDELPQTGSVYTVASLALSSNPASGNHDLAVKLEGFDRVCFRPERFAAQGAAEVTVVHNAGTPNAATPSLPATRRFPKLVIRMHPVVYQTEAIGVTEGAPEVNVGYQRLWIGQTKMRGSRLLRPKCWCRLFATGKKARSPLQTRKKSRLARPQQSALPVKSE